jgi:hypothetical protein
MKGYSVKDWREAGINARWARTRVGAPALLVKSGKKPWTRVTKEWTDRIANGESLIDVYDRFTLLIDIFSIPDPVM